MRGGCRIARLKARHPVSGENEIGQRAVRIIYRLRGLRSLSCRVLTPCHPGLTLWLRSRSPLGALAQRTGLDQSTLSRNLRGLEADGLVEIAIVASDLRRRMVWLTETGARRLEAAIPVWRAAHAKLAKSLSVKLARQLASQATTLMQ